MELYDKAITFLNEAYFNLYLLLLYTFIYLTPTIDNCDPTENIVKAKHYLNYKCYTYYIKIKHVYIKITIPIQQLIDRYKR